MQIFIVALFIIIQSFHREVFNFNAVRFRLGFECRFG